MELRFGFAHQPVAPEQEALFHLSRCNIPEATPLRRQPKVVYAKDVVVESALSTAGSSFARSLSSFLSYLSNIIF